MAQIQEKLKGKKIVSFKFKVCVGRDADGKQIFKCKTWYPPAELTPAKARKEAQKVAVLWEDEAKQAYLKEQEGKIVAGCSSSHSYTFDAFVNEVWLPCCHCEPVTDVTGVAIPQIDEKTLKNPGDSHASVRTGSE